MGVPKKESGILEHIEKKAYEWKGTELELFGYIYLYHTWWKETGTGGFAYVSDAQLYPGKFSKWSDKDLQFIINNLDNITEGNANKLLRHTKPRHKTGVEQFLHGITVTTTLGASTWLQDQNPLTPDQSYKVGLLPAIELQVKAEDPGNPKLFEAFLAVLLRRGGTEGLSGNDKNTIGKYFRLNEDKILELFAFEKFKFTSFDLAITAKINEFLKTNPVINGLERALFNGSIKRDYYQWASDKDIWIYKDKVVAAKVDTSLYSSLQANYQQPFNDSEQKNDILLDEERGFTNFKAGKIERKDYWFWGQLTTLASVEGAYADFLVEFINVLKRSTDGKYTYEDKEGEKVFTDGVDNYVNKTFELPVLTGEADATGLTYTEVNYTFTPRTFAGKMILDVLRKAAWKQYRDDLKNIPLKDLKTETDEKRKERTKRAFETGEDAAKNSEAAVGGEPAEGEALSQKEIEARQKFLKQCALMTRLPQLQREHLQTIEKTKKVHKHGAYNDRFYMAKDGDLDQSGIMTKLLLPKGKNIKEFLNITPAVHAHLTPKLRFFKVFDGNSAIEQKEFKFRNFTSRSRVDSSLAFDKGGDYGIKEFSFSFEGTTPATAKNDIKANLSLYFQSFQDFIDKGFVDMLLLPKGNAAEPQESKFAYSPRYYRLRVDVGWNIDSLNVETLKAKLGNARLGQLKNALIKTNKSFYLNMVDHTLDFKDDGSVQIDVEYRAYIESSTKGSKLDALASPAILEMRDQIKKDYNKVLNANKCNLKELSMIKSQLDQISDLMIKQSFQSIMNRLIDNDCMYFKKFRETAEDLFQRRGFFTSKVKFSNETKEPKTKETKAAKAKKDVTLKVTADSFDEDLSNDKDYLYVNYFYLGDLLYVILDSLYSTVNGARDYRSGYENFKFILGSFQYEDVFTGENHVINLAQIPISCELFFEWFTENVLKPERPSYPITYFIRDLCKYLIGEILSENCFRKSLDKTMQFQTTNFVGIGNPFGSLKGNIKDIGKAYSPPGEDKSVFPLAQDSAKEFSVKHLTNYIMIYVNAPKLQIKKTDPDYKRGKKSSDEDIGIYHYQIGKPHGLLKKLKFAKTDMQYIREARFMRSGFDGLLQLAAVYKVTLEMVGNTLYYPGMEIFVNPLGFMGAANNNYNPTKVGTVANKLGFGGYHLVTSVRSTIGPGKFTTQVEAMFNYSGDGDPASTVVGSRESTKKDKAITDKTETFKAGGYCADVYNQVINRALAVNDGAQYTSIDSTEWIEKDKKKAELIAKGEENIKEIVDAGTNLLKAVKDSDFAKALRKAKYEADIKKKKEGDKK